MGSFMSPRTTAEPAVKKQAVYDAIQLHITLKVSVLRPKLSQLQVLIIGLVTCAHRYSEQSRFRDLQTPEYDM